MKLFGNEKDRRRLDKISDAKPSVNHYRNYFFSKKYIIGKKLLDVGCWTGQFEQLALKDAKKIVAIDPGKEAIEYAKEKHPKIKFIAGTLDDIKLPINSFDTASLFDVLEHLPADSEIQTLRKINSLLKKNGYLIITTPSNHLLSILLDPAFFLLGHRHYSKKRLISIVKSSGFKVEKIFSYGNLATLLDGILDLVEKYLLRRKTWIRKIIQKKSSEIRESGFASICIIAKK